MPPAATNPFTNPPRLPSPSGSRLHNRQLSRSPARQNPRDCDSLLRDLSPSSTLRAFVALPQEIDKSDALAASLQTSSASERALGAKAAKACLDLRSWTLELEGWEWPGSFDCPKPARERRSLSTIPTDTHVVNGADEEEYWGSLPATVATNYERRADEISQRLDDIDVEELKGFVLNSHYRAESNPTSSRDKRLSLSSTSSGSGSMKHLDDYTALVTATILQALPFLTRLTRLLDVWTIRLIVLRSAARFLLDLRRARDTLDNGWAALRAPSNSRSPPFDRKIMLDMKFAIEQQVGSLGRRLDRFLDDLEGREDTVPDTWIDEFEVLEAGYGSWVVHAERKVLENEWQARKDSIEQRSMTATHHQGSTGMQQAESAISEVEDPALDDGAVMRPSMDTERGDPSAQLRSWSHPQLVVSIPPPYQNDQERSASSSARTVSHSATVSSSSKEEEAKQVAKRRAAFLHDIETNNALKQSKSPVRPFEHASSAFTKLFKKHQSPEQVRPKRSVSTNVDVTATTVGASPSSATSSRSKQFGAQGSVQSDRHSTIAPSSTVSSNDPLRHEISQPEVSSRRSVSEPTRTATPDVSSFDRSPFDVSENPPPKTYRPTGLDSPFSSPGKENFAETDKQEISARHANDAPDDWPLQQVSTNLNIQSSGVLGLEERLPNDAESNSELHKPSKPIQTDTFDQLFVRNMPSMPADFDSPRAADILSLSPHESKAARDSTVNNLEMVPGGSRRSSVRGPTSPSRPRTASYDREYASIPIVPERFGARQDPGMGSASRLAEENTSPSADPAAFTSDARLVSSSRPASPDSIHIGNAEKVSLGDVHVVRPNMIKRASMTSIEMFSRAEVKSVDVQRPSRHGSVSSKPTPPQTPKILPELDAFGKTRPLSYKGMVSFPAPPMQRNGSSDLVIGSASAVLENVKESSPHAANTPSSPASIADTAPLNTAMTKRRPKRAMPKENERPDSPAQQPPQVDARDTFDRHVSEVLETLPAQIRFKPRSGAVTPVPRGYMAPRAKMPNSRVPSRASNMTIAPAESSPKKSSLTSDPEVKLYHLTQAGREEPIKLFVRLVGEGERVMVRVGGGWADLADYLRQYADHHGSRTVSEGGLEVQALAATHAARRVSGPLETRASTPGPGTPKNGTPLRPSSNDSDMGFFGHANTPGGERAYAANGRKTPNSAYVSTPQSTSTGSRPSTANGSRPPSRQGNMSDVGLSGPSSGKKGMLPEHKAKWVESMLDRAKKASAEKKSEDSQKYFSELGKAGGTRRVIFRSSPGVSTGERNSNK